jgi:hypothetical protein
MSERPVGDDAFVAQARDALERVPVSDDVRLRLAAARHRAVESLESPIPRAPARWVPVGALATTLLTVGIGVAVQRPAAPPVYDEQQLATVEDMDLLMDLEFVAWLDTDNVDAG